MWLLAVGAWHVWSCVVCAGRNEEGHEEDFAGTSLLRLLQGMAEALDCRAAAPTAMAAGEI